MQVGDKLAVAVVVGMLTTRAKNKRVYIGYILYVGMRLASIKTDPL